MEKRPRFTYARDRSSSSFASLSGSSPADCSARERADFAAAIASSKSPAATSSFALWPAANSIAERGSSCALVDAHAVANAASIGITRPRQQVACDLFFVRTFLLSNRTSATAWLRTLSRPYSIILPGGRARAAPAGQDLANAVHPNSLADLRPGRLAQGARRLRGAESRFPANLLRRPLRPGKQLQLPDLLLSNLG